MLTAGETAGRPAGPVRTVREATALLDGIDLFILSEWETRLPGLAAGITGLREDFGLSTGGSAWELAGRYERLATGLGFPAVALGRQVHGSEMSVIHSVAARGVWIAGEADGLVTDVDEALLVVTAADCVPVYVVDEESGALALLHAGWRGTAAGVLASGLRGLARLRGADPSRCRVHLGPAICGACYEVGPEVLARFGHGNGGSGRLDLRAWLADEAVRLGVPAAGVSISAWCTSCDEDRFHSHRASGGRAGRMAAYLGRRPCNGPGGLPSKGLRPIIDG